MKNTSIQIATFLLMVTLLSGFTGCIPGQSSQNKYNEGYGFLNAKIYPLAAQSNTIYIYEEDQTTEFTAEITNEMYLEAKNVRLIPDNYNPLAINLDSIRQMNIASMPGYNRENGYKDLQIIEETVNVNTLQDRPYSTTLRFHVCAEATTYLETQVCIRPQGQIDNLRGTCNPGTVALPRGQGAPVAFTSVSQFDSGNSITFQVNVVNRGKGIVYRQGDSGCEVISQDSVGVVNLNYLKVGDVEARCERTTERLGYTLEYQANAGATFMCIFTKEELDLPTTGGPQTYTLQSSISYNYHTELPSQNIIIRNAPGYTSKTP